MGGFFLRVGILLSFFFVGMFVSCSTIKQQDDVLRPYVRRFSFHMGIDESELRRFSVTFDKLSDDPNNKGGTVGKCNLITNDITIDPSYWFEGFLSETQKTSLIYHEFGHCYCILSHDNSLLHDGCPKSLMFSDTINYMCLERHWLKYITELKNKCRNRHLNSFDKLWIHSEF